MATLGFTQPVPITSAHHVTSSRLRLHDRPQFTRALRRRFQWSATVTPATSLKKNLLGNSDLLVTNVCLGSTFHISTFRVSNLTSSKQ